MLEITSIVLALAFPQGEANPALTAPSFHQDIRPILQAKCQGCHQPAKAKGGVDLTSHAAIMRGTKDGPILAVRDSHASLLLDVVLPVGDEPPDMPEDDEPLTAEEVDLLRRWIDDGAADDTPASLQVEVSAEHPPVYTQPPVLTSLAWSPDGKSLAVSGYHEVLVHRQGEAKPQRLVGMSERIQSLAYSPDGTLLAVAGGSPARFGELQIWDVNKAKLQLSVTASFDTLYGVSWSPDASKIAFGCADNTVRVINVEDGREILYQGAHNDWVLGTEFSSDASHLVTVSRDRSMKLYKVETDQFIDNITSITPGALKGGLLSVMRRPGTDQLLVGGADGTARLYKMYREKKRVIGDDFNLIRAFEPIPGRIFSVAFQADGNRIACGSSWQSRGYVQFSNTNDGKSLWTVELPAPVYDLSFHPQGDRISVACGDGWVRTLSTSDGKVVRQFMPVPISILPDINLELDSASAQGAAQ